MYDVDSIISCPLPSPYLLPKELIKYGDLNPIFQDHRKTLLENVLLNQPMDFHKYGMDISLLFQKLVLGFKTIDFEAN